MNPEITVVIPLYNGKKYISETIKSVLSQTYGNYETVVVDDGSTDGSFEILETSFKGRIRYFRQENSGISAARNKGIAEARGEFIAFLDHDDKWLPEKLEKQMGLFRNNPETGLVYSNSFITDENGARHGTIFDIQPPYRGKVFYKLLKADFMPVATVMVKKNVIDQAGVFSGNFSVAEDWDLFLRISKKYQVDYVDEALAEYKVHSGGFSTKRVLALEELNKIMDFYIDDKNAERNMLAEEGIYGISTDYKFSLAMAYLNEGRKSISRRILMKAVKRKKRIWKLILGLALSFFPSKLYKSVIANYTSVMGMHASKAICERE